MPRAGRWGCGAFGGDTELKILLQLLAASVARRALILYTFGDEALSAATACVHRQLVAGGATVGDVWTALLRYEPTQTKKAAARFEPNTGKGVREAAASAETAQCRLGQCAHLDGMPLFSFLLSSLHAHRAASDSARAAAEDTAGGGGGGGGN